MSDINFNLQQFIVAVIILIPIGIIGVWRWIAWFIKSMISNSYQDPAVTNALDHWKVGIALTVKGEPPDTFQELLESTLAEQFDQLCIVFDAGETVNIEAFEAFAKANKKRIDARYKVTDKKGKRTGLEQAIRMCEGTNVTFLMDSDTVLHPGVKKAAVSAFVDEKIGGVAIAQRVKEPDNWVKRLFDLMLSLRYEQEISGQSVGKRVSCLSGRCSAYLTEPLQEIAPGLLDEEWAGIKKTGGGDDKFLTTRMHDLGYLTVLVRDYFVSTRAEPDFGVFLKQRLRWTRNSWFSDLRAVMTRDWMRKSPILFFYTLDRMLASFTILLAPLFFAYTIITGNTLVSFVIVIWWIVSRLIKTWPYLRRTGDIAIVPLYTVVGFIIGCLKIHALVTLGEGSWLTRDSGAQSWRTRFSWALTLLIIVGLGALVWGPLTPG